MEGNHQPDGFQSSSPFNRCVPVGGLTFTPPSNLAMHGHHPVANMTPMDGNGMPPMFGQPPLVSPVARPRLSNSPFQNYSADTPPQSQTTPSRMAQFIPYPSPRNLYPDNTIALLEHRPQPQPQPRSQSPPQNAPQSELFSGIHFQSAVEVRDHLVEVAWYPAMGNYGIPQTDEQYRFYLLKIYNALQNTKEIWDQETAAWNYSKFLPGPLGEWTDPKDVEAVAHMVLHLAVKFHEEGVTNLAHRRSADYWSCNREDIDFTFPQRIHFLADLLTHSKTAAAEVMAGLNVEKYIALPITTLRLFAPFEMRWQGTVGVEKWHWVDVVPYNGTGVVHPSRAVQMQLRTAAALRWIYDEGKRQMNQEARTLAQTLATPMHQSPALYADGGIAGGKRPATGSPEQRSSREGASSSSSR